MGEILKEEAFSRIAQNSGMLTTLQIAFSYPHPPWKPFSQRLGLGTNSECFCPFLCLL